MRRWDPLNDRQLAVLRRIAAGDDLHDADNSTRRSASAMRDRGLVAISKRDGWHVVLTQAGQFYVDHGCHPDHPDAPTDPASIAVEPTSTQRTAVTTQARPDTTTSTGATKRPPPHATARIARERQAAAEQLIAELLVTPRKFLKNLTEDDFTTWRRVVDFAKRNRLVPAGKYLETLKPYGGRLEIHLREGQHPNTKAGNAELPPVPMPTQLRSLHPVVAALQDDRGRLIMPASVRLRSLLFLHGLTTEAVRRGHEVREQPVPERYRYQYWDRAHPGHKTYSRRDGELNIVVDGFAYTVNITQESPDSDVDGRWERLVVSLSYRSQGRQYHWYDRNRFTIDDRIAVVLHELETRATEDKQRQLEAEREKAERAIRWQKAMKRAKKRATQAYYAGILDHQADAWHRVNALREYCDALEARIDEASDDAADAKRWLTWSRKYITAADPLTSLPTMPASPKLQKRDLGPFLDGWSPYGPEEPESGRYR